MPENETIRQDGAKTKCKDYKQTLEHPFRRFCFLVCLRKWQISLFGDSERSHDCFHASSLASIQGVPAILGMPRFSAFITGRSGKFIGLVVGQKT
jgi:hypothetical protein